MYLINGELLCDAKATKPVRFGLEYLRDFAKIGITELTGADESKAFAGQNADGVHGILMPMKLQ